ncbi:MAG TPA: hypothetical protein VGG56_13620 [Terracidiphilus sp.]|jgi:hypothetical protein
MIGMAKGRSLILKIAAVASVVTSAVFQLAIVVSDGWLRIHLPPYMPYAWGLCAVLWVWWGIVAMGSARANSKSVLPRQSMKIGRDNFGSPLTAGRDIHYHAPSPVQAVAPPVEPPIPITFTIHQRPGNISYETEMGCWKDCSGYSECKNALLLDVIRDVPSRGERGGGAVAVIAILKFTSNQMGHVPRAYWLNRPDCVAWFNAGDRESLIVGTVENSLFVAYENPKHGTLPEDNFVIPFRSLGPKIEMPKVPLGVEISWYDCSEEITIQQNRLEIIFTEKGMSVEVVS